VRLVSPIGGTTGGNGNLATSLSNVARVAAHSKFVWVFNANYDGTIIYNDPVLLYVEFSGVYVHQSLAGQTLVCFDIFFGYITSL
jgi:hypothetical protein